MIPTKESTMSAAAVSAIVKPVIAAVTSALAPKSDAGVKIDSKETKLILKAASDAYENAKKAQASGKITQDEQFIDIPCAIGHGLAQMLNRSKFQNAIDWKHVWAVAMDGMSADPNPPDVG
jgi:hypothetical protein